MAKGFFPRAWVKKSFYFQVIIIDPFACTLPIVSVTTAALFGSQCEMIGVACRRLRVRLTAGREKKQHSAAAGGCGDDYQMPCGQYLRNAMRSGNVKQAVGPPSWNRSPVGGIVRRVRVIHCQEESSDHIKRVLSMDFFPRMALKISPSCHFYGAVLYIAHIPQWQ